MKNRFKHNQLLFRLLSSYIVILCIPLLVGGFIYLETLHIIENDAYEGNLSLLEQSMNIIDKHLAETDKMISQFAFNTSILNFLNINNPLLDGTSVMDVKTAQDYITPYQTLNGFVNTFHIYSRKSDSILTPGNTYLRLENFYGDIFRFNNLTYTQWQEQILNRWHKREALPVTAVTINGLTYSTIPYIQSLPIDGIGELKGNIVAFIDEREVLRLFDQLTIKKGGWAFISDAGGRILVKDSSSGSEIMPQSLNLVGQRGYFKKRINGVDVLISYTTSSYCGWKYVAAVPISIVTKKASHIKGIVWILALMTLIFGYFLSYLLAYHNSKPIRNLISMIWEKMGESHMGDKGEYSFLNDTVSSLIYNNQTLQEDMKKQIPYLKITLFYRLLNGEFHNEAEIREGFARVGIELKGQKYAVLILTINDYMDKGTDEIINELNAAKVLIKNTIYNNLLNVIGLYDMDFEKTAIVVYFENCDVKECIDSIEERVRVIYNTLQNQMHINVSFAGSLAEDLSRISIAFYEAKLALNYKFPSGNFKVSWHRQNTYRQSFSFYYPIDMEMKLINAIRSLDKKGVNAIISSIYRENFAKMKLSDFMKKQLIIGIKGTLIRLYDANLNVEEMVQHMDQLLDNMDSQTDCRKIFDSIKDIFSQVCECVESAKDMQNHALIEKMIDYIKMNYMDPQFSLLAEAEHLNLTETYVSKFFKEQTGETFSGYVEKLRIEKACSLLRENELPVSEISRVVGYNSPQVFRRVFKRIYRTSPTDFNSNDSNI